MREYSKTEQNKKKDEGVSEGLRNQPGKAPNGQNEIMRATE